METAPNLTRTIPDGLGTELLSRIFKDTLSASQFPPLAGPGSAPNLSAVCHRWRVVGLKSPPLWSAIELDARDADLSKTRLHLQRSGKHPLSLKYDGGGFEESESSKEITDISVMELLLPERTRWERVDFRFMEDIPAVLGHPSPRLVEIRIGSSRDGICDDWKELDIQSSLVPRLRTLVLYEAPWGISGATWLSLTTLVIANSNPHTSWPILRAATNVVHLKVHIDELVMEDYPDNYRRLKDPLKLPQLQTLVLTIDCGGSDSEDVLGGFVVPALRRLEVTEEYLGYKKQRAHRCLKSFVEKNVAHLEVVKVVARTQAGQPAHFAWDLDKVKADMPSIKFVVKPLVYGDADLNAWLDDEYWEK